MAGNETDSSAIAAAAAAPRRSFAANGITRDPLDSRWLGPVCRSARSEEYGLSGGVSRASAWVVRVPGARTGWAS
jgi:hypothetical protein